ncbi:MAG: hypothetical protein U1E46_18745 [Hyphomicrobiales bacterium]
MNLRTIGSLALPLVLALAVSSGAQASTCKSAECSTSKLTVQSSSSKKALATVKSFKSVKISKKSKSSKKGSGVGSTLAGAAPLNIVNLLQKPPLPLKPLGNVNLNDEDRIADTPIPPAGLLLVTGLLGVGYLSRRKGLSTTAA